MKKSVKIIFFSDSHLGLDYPIRPRKDLPHRGNDFFENFQKVLDYAIKVKADLVLHGGDLFFRSKIPQLIIEKTYNIIRKFADHGIPICIVPGNHEKSKLPNPLFLSHENIYVFDEPEVKQFMLNGMKIEIAGFSFVRDIHEAFLQMQSEFKFSDKSFRIFLNHQTISGARVENYVFRRGKNVIDINDLSRQYNIVLAGHIHRYQYLKRKTEKRVIPIFYSGSIERTSFQEVNEDKGFMEIDVRRDFSFKSKFIKLEVRPMVMIEITQKWNPKNFDELLTKAVSKIPSNASIRFVPGNNVNKKIRKLFSKENLYKIIPHTNIIETHRKLCKSNTISEHSTI